MKVAISRQKENIYEVREFDLSKGLPNLAGLRILYVQITHEDVKAGSRNIHFHDWIYNILMTRFIP